MRSFSQASKTVDHLICIYIYLFICYYIYLVLTVLSINSLEECVRQYANYNLRSKRFYFVFLNYDYYKFSSISFEDLIGSFIPTSYYKDISSITNYAFLKNAKEEFDRNLYVTPAYERIYIALELYKEAVISALTITHNEWPESDYVRLSLPDLQYQSPSGLFTMKDSNYASQVIYYMEISSSGLNQLSPAIGETKTYEPIPYFNGISSELLNTKSIEILKRNEYAKWIGISLSILNSIIILICLIFIIQYRRKRIIVYNSPLYQYCILFGLLIGSMSVITLTIEPSINSVVCYVRINLVTFSIMFVSSLFFLKAKKYNSTKKKIIKKIHITLSSILKMFLVSYIIPLLVTLLYQFISGSHYILSLSSDDSTFLVDYYYEECSENDIFVYILFIIIKNRIITVVYIGLYLFSGLYLSFRKRKISPEFGDSMVLFLSFLVEYIFFIFYNYIIYLNFSYFSF